MAGGESRKRASAAGREVLRVNEALPNPVHARGSTHPEFLDCTKEASGFEYETQGPCRSVEVLCGRVHRCGRETLAIWDGRRPCPRTWALLRGRTP